jgi:hypothetical protein
MAARSTILLIVKRRKPLAKAPPLPHCGLAVQALANIVMLRIRFWFCSSWAVL